MKNYLVEIWFERNCFFTGVTLVEFYDRKTGEYMGAIG